MRIELIIPLLDQSVQYQVDFVNLAFAYVIGFIVTFGFFYWLLTGFNELRYQLTCYKQANDHGEFFINSIILAYVWPLSVASFVILLSAFLIWKYILKQSRL